MPGPTILSTEKKYDKEPLYYFFNYYYYAKLKGKDFSIPLYFIFASTNVPPNCNSITTSLLVGSNKSFTSNGILPNSIHFLFELKVSSIYLTLEYTVL